MSLRVVTPPADFVSLAEARAHLRMFDADDTSEDDVISALISAAIGNLDGPAGTLGRAIGPQTLELTLDRFPVDRGGCRQGIILPLPPGVSVTSVTYTKPDGTSGTVAGLRTLSAGSLSPAMVLPAVGSSWPQTINEPGSVVVLYEAGFEVVPAAIKHAVLLLVSHLFEHREAALDTGAKFGLLELPFGVRALVEPYRYWPPN